MCYCKNETNQNSSKKMCFYKRQIPKSYLLLEEPESIVLYLKHYISMAT